MIQLTQEELNISNSIFSIDTVNTKSKIYNILFK